MTLPTFLVIGAAKAGTTSLHHYLRQHPDVYLSPIKETNYYSAPDRMQGRAVPRTLEDYARRFAGATHHRAIGEISPQYLNNAQAAARIAADLPGVRLIACLRNPADRAYSDYLGRVRIARESRSIEDAIRPGERVFDDGLYSARLRRFLDHFPRAHLHVMLHDEFSRDPAAELSRLFAFLGVEPAQPIDTSVKHNPAEAPRSMLVNRLVWKALPVLQSVTPAAWRGSGRAEKLLRRTYRRAPAFPPDLRRRLVAAYRDDVLKTSVLIGRDLSAWLDA